MKLVYMYRLIILVRFLPILPLICVVVFFKSKYYVES